MTLEISAKKTALRLVMVVALLVILSVAGQFSTYYLDDDMLFGFVPKFDLDSETNIPTWYSTATLLLCSVLLAAIALAKTSERDIWAAHWRILAIIFVLLSIDEAAEVHEFVGKQLQMRLGTSGILFYAWVIPGGVGVLAMVGSYLRFLLSLDRRTRQFFLAAGVAYVGGALGMELAAGYYASIYGEETMTYAMIATVEELLEMAGVVVFLYALMSYLSLRVGEITVRFTSE